MSDAEESSPQHPLAFRLLLAGIALVVLITIGMVWSLANPNSMNPREANLAAGSADTLTGLGKLEEAEVIYTELLEQKRMEPSYGAYHLKRADLRYRLERFEEAVEDYQKAISYDPDGYVFQARWNLAQAYRQLGQNAKAIETFQAFEAEYGEELPHLTPRVNKAIELLQE